jgi:hypothetical protein
MEVFSTSKTIYVDSMCLYCVTVHIAQIMERHDTKSGRDIIIIELTWKTQYLEREVRVEIHF